MGIESKEMFEGVDCSITRNGATFTRKWKVWSDNDDEPLDRVQAATWADIDLGDRYKIEGKPLEDWNSYCSDVSAACDDKTGKVWTVIARYGPAEIQDQNQVDDPTLERPKPQYGFMEVEQIITHDTDGNPIVNSAGVPFNPPIKDRVSYPTISITKIEADYTLVKAFFYKDSVNGDMFYGCPPGTVKLQKITAVEEYFPQFLNYMTGQRGGTLYRVSYEFVIKPDGWKRRLASVGMQDLDDDGNLQPILGLGGVQVDSPVPLDQSGKRMPPGSTALFEIEYDTNKYMPFQALGLEQPLF